MLRPLSIALAFVVGGWLGWPQVAEPLPSEAPADRFAAARALSGVADLVQEPRPSGSRAHRAAVDALVERLGAAGLPARRVAYGELRNVEAGFGRRGGVWLVAHTDSVPRSPGASDDGLGLAVILEATRVLAAAGAPPGLHVLLTDGEEKGLLGARAFVEDAPDADRVIINVEARGSEGPAFMFQTAGAPGPLLAAWRSSGCTAQAGSLARWVYELLPNDTDFSAFRRAGASGYDFALIRGAWRYHTPDDTLEGLDPAAVQQIGDCVVGLARAWLEPRPEPAGGPLAWQQVGSQMVVVPAWGVRLAAVAGLIALVVAMRGPRRWVGALGWVGAMAGAGALGFALLLGLVAGWPGFLARPAEMPEPEPVYAVAWGVALLAVVVVRALGRRFGRGADFEGGWSLSGGLVSAGLAAAVPEVGLVLLPGVLVAAAGLLGRGRVGWALQLVGAFASGALLGPVLLALPAALTSRALPVLAVVPVALLFWLLPVGVGSREKTP